MSKLSLTSTFQGEFVSVITVVGTTDGQATTSGYFLDEDYEFIYLSTTKDKINLVVRKDKITHIVLDSPSNKLTEVLESATLAEGQELN